MNRYDIANLYAMENENESFIKEIKNNGSIFLNYFKYADLLNIEDTNLNLEKESFIRAMLNSKNNISTVESIMKSDEEIKVKTAYIEFLFSNIDLTRLTLTEESLKKLQTIVRDRNKEEKFYTKLNSKNKIIQLANTKLEIDSSIPAKIYFDYFNPNRTTMFYLPHKGTFISIGINNDISNFNIINEEYILECLKIVSDSTRFNIIKLLLKDNLTSTELSNSTKVSLSTINHHIKKLTSYDIVNLYLSDDNNRSTTFKLNKKMLLELTSTIAIYLNE